MESITVNRPQHLKLHKQLKQTKYIKGLSNKGASIPKECTAVNVIKEMVIAAPPILIVAPNGIDME